MKKRINITIDTEIYKKAIKKYRGKISQICENALNIVTIETK